MTLKNLYPQIFFERELKHLAKKYPSIKKDFSTLRETLLKIQLTERQSVTIVIKYA